MKKKATSLFSNDFSSLYLFSTLELFGIPVSYGRYTGDDDDDNDSLKLTTYAVASYALPRRSKVYRV